jgi:PAS domain S-box-containing protein
MEQLPNILLVDDIKDNVFFIKAIIEDINVNVIEAYSGEEALKKISGFSIALAIIDVRMPEMDGYTLALKIIEKRPYEKIPIIFLTASNFNEDEVFKGYELGAVDYIFKPVNHYILKRKIKIFLEIFNQNQIIINDANLLKKSSNKLRKINAILVKSEQKYKTILNTSPDGILLINFKGIITEASEIGLKLLGAEHRKAVVGTHYSWFIRSVEKDTVQEIIDKTLEEGIYQNIEITIKKKNQSLFLGEISATLVQEPYNKPFSFMLIVRDISVRKKMQKILMHTDRMASLGEMASGIAHELNQPLNSISLAMDNVLYKATNEENIEKGYLLKKADKIFENIIRIRNIIDHIRAFSRSGEDYILTGFDINLSINNAVSMVCEKFKHISIGMRLQLDENIPLINGNTYKFEQVILNLLSNASDALLEKKKKRKADNDMLIEIKSFQEKENLIIEIIDNGMGIPEEDMENIMLPFYTTKDTGKGTGLGLSISYQIIKEMGGTIELTSNLFYGTTFTIVFKL